MIQNCVQTEYPTRVRELDISTRVIIGFKERKPLCGVDDLDAPKMLLEKTLFFRQNLQIRLSMGICLTAIFFSCHNAICPGKRSKRVLHFHGDVEV